MPLRRCFWTCLILPAALVLTVSTGPSRSSQDSQPVKTGTIVGTVRYTGKVPEPKKIVTSDNSVILHNDLMVDDKTKGLRNVLVKLEGVKPRPEVKNAKPVLVDQRDMIFIPRVVAVQHGQAVVFTNSDLCNHSVMAVSTLKANQFNVYTPADRPFKVVFKLQERPVIIGCSLHPWMRAWVHVLPHPFFDVTDSKGKFTIDNVPAGKHTISWKHPDTGLAEQRTIQVKAGEATQLNVDWEKTEK